MRHPDSFVSKERNVYRYIDRWQEAAISVFSNKKSLVSAKK